MGKLTRLAPTLTPTSTAIAHVQPKVADSYYHSPEWKALRVACLSRAGYRCEAALPGCTHRASIADHIVSRRNGGSDSMPNLRAVCRSCDNAMKEDHAGRRRGGHG